MNYFDLPPFPFPFTPALLTLAIGAEKATLAERKRRQDDLLDQALLETFPASDPISVMRIA